MCSLDRDWEGSGGSLWCWETNPGSIHKWMGKKSTNRPLATTVGTVPAQGHKAEEVGDTTPSWFYGMGRAGLGCAQHCEHMEITKSRHIPATSSQSSP